jgi:hypothetical protein
VSNSTFADFFFFLAPKSSVVSSLTSESATEAAVVVAVAVAVEVITEAAGVSSAVDEGVLSARTFAICVFFFFFLPKSKVFFFTVFNFCFQFTK